MTFRRLLVLALASCLAPSAFLVGCDSAPPPAGDAGAPDDGGRDAGPPDAAPPLTCGETTRVDGVLDETVSVTLDTTMTEERPRDLGLACGNPSGELRWAPQEVLEVHVPGTGPVAVQFDTAFPETTRTFNTLVQVRPTCQSVPAQVFPPTCFDDEGTETRARGGFAAMGGDVVYLVVTGYSEPAVGQVDRGTVRIDLSFAASSAPVLSSAQVLLAAADTILTAAGTDSGGDARGVALNFYGPAGLLDIYGDGEATEDGDVFAVPFAPPPSGTDFMGQATVQGASVALAGYLRMAGATMARVRVYDAGWSLSAPLMVPITEAEIVGLGEVCDMTHVCGGGLVCNAGVCEATPAVMAACAGASALTVPPITDTRVEIDQTGVVRSGAGSFDPDSGCVADARATGGAETIYSLTLPAGTFDVRATTARPGTGTTDTILYMRSACVDSTSELDCNDDTTMLQSEISATDLAGDTTYALFVETYGGLASGTAPFEMRVTVTPVLASGAACDMAGMLNRCAAGACAAGVCP